MLYKNWDVYEKLMKEVDSEYVELAQLYALSKSELICKFKSYCEQKGKIHMLEELLNDNIEIDFVGEGYYDLCGFKYGIPIIMRIDETLKSQT